MKLFLIAGEPSGDALGAALIAGLRARAGAVEVAGIGGPLMAAEGLSSLFPMDELSIMGLAEVLPRYFALKRRIRQTAEAIVAARPDAVITIDSPDFCLRVLALARAADPALRTIHYVAPSVWAWRPGRAAKMAPLVDHVLALLPFEPPYMTAAGMSCDFVGHPIVAQPLATDAEAAALRGRLGIALDAPVLLVLPGSRRSEVTRHLPVFREVCARLAEQHPGLVALLPTTANVAPLVEAALTGWPVPVHLLDPRALPLEAFQAQKRAAFRAADVALAASGTVSLELAAAGTPMVIAYAQHPLTHAILSRMLRVDTVTLVNLVSETRSVPEFLGPACQAGRIAPAVQRLLADGPARAAQQQAMQATLIALGQGGDAPGLRAADSVLRFLSRRR